MSSVSGMSLYTCWIPSDHITEGTQDLSLPVSQTGAQNNRDLNTPKGFLLEGDHAMPFPPLLPAVPKSWKGFEDLKSPFPSSTKHRWGREDGTMTKAQRHFCCLYGRKNIKFLSSFPSHFPRPLNPDPHSLPLCWCGRKGSCEARWALILQPQGTHISWKS